MLEDLSTKIKAQLYDRAGSPLIYAYIISWISWNFRTVLLIISDGSFEKKIEKVNSLYPSNWDYFLQGIVFPFLSSAAFISIYPFLAMFAFWHWHTQHAKVKKIQQTIEDKTPATQEEINALRKASLDREVYLQSEVSRAYITIKEHKTREDEIQKQSIDLQSQISILNSTMIAKNDEIKSLNVQISHFQSELENLKKLALQKNETEKNLNRKYVPKSKVIRDSASAKNAYFNAIKNLEFQDLKPEEIEMMIQLTIFNGQLKASELKSFNDHLTNIEFEYSVNNLKILDLVKGSVTYSLTDKSRKIIVEEGFSDLNSKFKKEFKLDNI